MKKFTSLLIGCSLALAGAALAQDPQEQSSPKPKEAVERGKGRGNVDKPKPNANEGRPKANVEAKPRELKAEGMPAERQGAKKEPAAAKAEMTPKAETTAPVQQRGGKNARSESKVEMTPKPAASVAAKTDVAGEPAATATPATDKRAGQRGKGAKTTAPSATTAPTATASAAPAKAASATPAATVAATATPTAAATASATATPTASATAAASVAPSVSAAPSASATPATSSSVASSTTAALPTPKPNTAAATKKPDQQKIQQIKTEHATFRAQPRPEQVPAVTFNQNYRVEGSDRWQGQQYEVFRSYRPERHDENYYRSRYSRVELIGGGYYYQNNNYWYPAWGYNPRNEYYAYDGPIYVGRRAEPPDRVIADVQAALQQMGYYRGEVDGLLGPLTRKALLGYQEDAGLQATAAIDEPTLNALDMSS